MAYGRFNPLDDTNTYPFMNGRNPGVYGNSYKTFTQLLEDINAKGFNTAIIRPSKSGDGNLAYYAIIAFNIPDSDTFRIGNDEYFTGSYYPNGIYFENFGDVSVPNVAGYYYANGSLVDTGVSYTLYTRCSVNQSKDNVSYHGLSGDDNNCLDLGCAIVSNANVGTWYFNNSPLVTYTWSTVSSISGKNGTLNLTEILNINDGDPVNDVPYTDNVDFTAVSKVNNMVAAVVQDSNAVIVEYTVPEDTYEYIKLVCKKDHIPEFVSDGTVTNISQGSGEKAILGIADGGTYWFVIFTDKSTSEPVEFRTSATGWDGSEVILMWSGENNKLTAQVSEGHILFKMYSGNTVVYSFTAESGATVADSYNIYVQFLEDENQQIAKPSFVYYGSSTGYSINQEIPTDEEMADIYSWLHPSS